MQVAIASTDGLNVDEHFGRAKRFLIYELAAGEDPVFCRKVPVTSLSTGDRQHEFDRAAFSGLMDALQGCKRVYVTKIGERPASELKKAGVEPVIHDGPISEIRG